jgi:outer membrane protein assembly factor BamA
VNHVNNSIILTFVFNMWIRLIVLFAFLSSLNFICGQERNIHIHFTNDDYKIVKRNIKTDFKDSISAIKYLLELQTLAIKDGYLGASIDKIEKDVQQLNVDFHVWDKFKSAVLIIEEGDRYFLREFIRINEKLLTVSKLKPSAIAEIMTSLRDALINNGYPFAQIKLQADKIETSESTFRVSIQKNKYYTWTKIIIKGDSSISEKFFSNLSQIKIGEPYSEKSFQEITQAISASTFVKENKRAELLFTQNGVELYVYLSGKKVNSINGFLGLQPKVANGGYALTGEVDLQLLNSLKRGELFSLKWRNIIGQTQQFKSHLNYPFLFSSPFGLDGSFQLYKRDTSFLEIKSKLAVQYLLKSGNTVSFFFQRNNSELLAGGKTGQNSTQFASVQSNNYGLGWTKQKVDYLPNPRRGYSLSGQIALGQRTSRQNDSSIIEKNMQVHGGGDFNVYFPIAKRHVINIGAQTQYLDAPNLYQNELYRFGGLLSQRGFNEDEFYASSLSILSVEYRFLLDKNSRVFLFYDQSYYDNRSVKTFDSPYGFGAGFAFGTEVGTFSILYALGSQKSNPIEFRSAKIHFGYLAYF